MSVDLDRLLAKISERLYPIDPTTGLRIYNPDGKRTINVDGDEPTATNHRGRGDEILGGRCALSSPVPAAAGRRA